MARPIKYRKTRNYTDVYFLQPTKESSLTGLNIIFCRPIEITLFSDEIEALKLRNVFNLSQSEIAKKMKISQPTIARTLKRAYKKITRAILDGKVIKIENMHSYGPEKNHLGALFEMQRLKD